jgi:hypothetical protein
MTIDGLTAALVLLGFSTLVGIVVWLVKGRLDKADKDMDRLKGSVVYGDTCEAHRETQATGMQMIATGVEEIKSTQGEQGKVLVGLATDVAVIKSNSLKPKEGSND